MVGDLGVIKGVSAEIVRKSDRAVVQGIEVRRLLRIISDQRAEVGDSCSELNCIAPGVQQLKLILCHLIEPGSRFEALRQVGCSCDGEQDILGMRDPSSGFDDPLGIAKQKKSAGYGEQERAESRQQNQLDRSIRFGGSFFHEANGSPGFLNRELKFTATSLNLTNFLGRQSPIGAVA